MIVKQLTNTVDPESLIPLASIKPRIGVDWSEDDEEVTSIRNSSIQTVSGFVKYPINKTDSIIILDLVNGNKDEDRIRAGFDAQKMPINSISQITRVKPDGTEEILDSQYYNYNPNINSVHFNTKMQHKKEGFTQLYIYCNIGWDCGTLPDEIKKALYAVAIETYDKPDLKKDRSLLSPACNYKFYN